MHTNQTSGILYIVATPIGNLEDCTSRALSTLGQVDLIAVEDTRHSKKLLQSYGIDKPLYMVHAHNEASGHQVLLDKLKQGNSIALISDAGTPLISDPGYVLVKQAHEQNIQVVPIPGPSAVITALCASGLPTDRFAFEGFLPAKSTAKSKKLQALQVEPRTMVFYEAPHRILDTLMAMEQVFGAERVMAFSRELTKRFETIKKGTIQTIREWVAGDAMQQKGEMVLVISGYIDQKVAAPDQLDETTKNILKTLLAELPVKQSSRLASQLTGVSKKVLYQQALQWAESHHPDTD